MEPSPSQEEMDAPSRKTLPLTMWFPSVVMWNVANGNTTALASNRPFLHSNEVVSGVETFVEANVTLLDATILAKSPPSIMLLPPATVSSPLK